MSSIIMKNMYVSKLLLAGVIVKNGGYVRRLLRQQVEKVENGSEMTVLAAMPSSVVRLLLVE